MHRPFSSHRSAARVVAFALLGALLAAPFTGCKASESTGDAGASAEVVLYASLDDSYSRPFAEAFERDTGIKVKFATDSEATKTTGLVTRLISERARPRCDVFWNNEIVQTILLKNEGVLEPFSSPNAADIPEAYKDPDGYWVGFGARARVIIYNTEMVTGTPPATFEALVDPAWKGKATLARPLNGTTASHIAVLWHAWGKDRVKALFDGLFANDVRISAGNAQVMMQVAQGSIPWGFTDTDDFHVALLDGKPVDLVFPDADGAGTLLLPNTVCKIKGGPNPANAQKLIDYILRRETEAMLAKGRSAQIPVRDGIARPTGLKGLDAMKVMPVDWNAVGAVFPTSHEWLKERLRGK